MASKGTPKQLGFEERLHQLEEMADRMEQPELPLEELMKLYEDGVKLSKELTQKLESMKASMQEVKQSKEGKITLQNSDVDTQTSMQGMF